MPRTTTEPSPFGAMLQRLRRRAGLSQQELAERAGLSLRGIADLERGVRRNPYPATVRWLVEALGLDEAARTALMAVAQPDEPASRPTRVEPTPSLPLPLSSFVGREGEVAEVQRLSFLGWAQFLSVVLPRPGAVGTHWLRTRRLVCLPTASALR